MYIKEIGWEGEVTDLAHDKDKRPKVMNMVMNFRIT
jgi:hypothetical protein